MEPPRTPRRNRLPLDYNGPASRTRSVGKLVVRPLSFYCRDVCLSL